jgi:hypothetical protein
MTASPIEWRPGFKRCRGRCSELLPLEAFGRHAISPDGLASRCKLCRSAEQRERYWRSPEKSRESLREKWASDLERAREWSRSNRVRHADENRKRAKAYAARPENAERIRAYQAAYRDAHREKLREQDRARYVGRRAKQLAAVALDSMARVV